MILRERGGALRAMISSLRNILRVPELRYKVLFTVAVIGLYRLGAFVPIPGVDVSKQADIIRKQGGFIPGIRPGLQTERYLAKILSRITLPGALFIAVVALLPSLLMTKFLPGTQVSFSGISILIAVGVALETMKQIESQLMMRNYEGFLS
jgi:preprotein translocase subunit SecY